MWISPVTGVVHLEDLEERGSDERGEEGCAHGLKMHVLHVKEEAEADRRHSTKNEQHPKDIRQG